MNRRNINFIICLLLLGGLWPGRSSAQFDPNLDRGSPEETAWVDSVFLMMTPEERLGQLFMIRAYSDKGPDHVASIERLVREWQVGGLCFFQGTPEEQVRLTNLYQSLTNHVPLMIAIDGEWGLGMRMKETAISYPRQLMLGAIQDNHLIYEMGKEVARQLHRIGVHVNFAPVVDVNNNPANPVIGTRSFGEDRYNVTAKSFNYAMGMQDHGILPSAKHFPGHGDTDVDSHYDLPVIKHNRRRLDSIELYPFQALVQHGIGSVMVGHLQVPALDSRDNRPTSLSENTVTALLRRELGFRGLIFTDGLGMQGVTKYYESGEVEAEALLAGADMLLLPESLADARREIQRYIKEGRISQAEVDGRIKRVLRAKYRLGLKRFYPIPENDVRTDVNRADAVDLKQRLIENALTLVQNRRKLLPFDQLDSLNIASLAIGASSTPFFQQRLRDYANVDLLRTGNSFTGAEESELLRRLRKEEVVIVSFHDMNNSASGNFGISSSARSFLGKLKEQNQVVVVLFGNPYALKFFEDFDTILEAYDDGRMTQDVAAQALFGAIALNGRLPVTASAAIPFNTGQRTARLQRFGYSLPERVGLLSDSLHAKIGRIMDQAIRLQATPGGVVLVARHGQIIFHEAYGNHTYDKNARPVRNDDLYDLASVTKVAATTLAVMDLYEKGLIELDTSLGHYLPELRNTNKGKLKIRQILAHYAGLRPWIPFYTQTLARTRRTSKPSPTYYRNKPSGNFNIEINNKLFLRDDFIDVMWKQISGSELRTTYGYRYSDLGFYLLARIVETVGKQPLDEYVASHFYRPLGLHDITYRPKQNGVDLSRIPPTEDDRYWRKQRVHGYVHDMGAAMLGGVSGHAGLFASAHDLAVLLQMLVQGGEYAGRAYLSPETIRQFATRLDGSTRRGLGFDMKQLNKNLSLNLSPLAGENTYGHLGFTGTCVWVDPDQELVFVFLTNRTFPSMRNYKINRLDVRSRLQTAVYKSFQERNPPRVTTVLDDPDKPVVAPLED